MCIRDRVAYSTNGDGTPVIALSPAPNANYADGFLANPHNYWMQFIQDHWENNDADEVAARADVEYDLGSGGWLSSLKAGVRFADREQKVRYSSSVSYTHLRAHETGRNLVCRL